MAVEAGAKTAIIEPDEPPPLARILQAQNELIRRRQITSLNDIDLSRMRPMVASSSPGNVVSKDDIKGVHVDQVYMEIAQTAR